MLLGAPGTGKTRLQSRYILRQFVDIDPEHTHRMGGHKHLHLLDGTEVHLIIHELRTGRGMATTDAEDCQRKRLLEQSDAVMLTFNPWSKESFDWISGKVVEDILYTGQKKQLTSDIIRLLDDLASAIPQRTKSNRSIRPFRYIPKRLPHRPDDPEDSDSDVSLFSSGDEKRDKYDSIDYRGELKRISIVVEGSVLKKAEFMIHEKDLPPPPPQSPTPSPLYVPSPAATTNARKLATISEASEGTKTAKQVAVMMNKKYLPIMKHDSMISMQSSMSRSSTYSQADPPPFPYDRATSTQSPAPAETHPALRPATFLSGSTVREEEPLEELSRRRTRTPRGETEIPVLVVATMMDRLKDGGGNLERRVTADEGQRLARKFGHNCAYIETSARSNANVDEAYGIIVDQVMAKRSTARRDAMARARIEAAIQGSQPVRGAMGGGNGAGVSAGAIGQSRPFGGGAYDERPETSKRTRYRGCAPVWGWLRDRIALPSWDAVTGALLAVWRLDEDDGSASGPSEDIWGDKTEVKRKSHVTPVEADAGNGNGERRSWRQSKSLLSRTSTTKTKVDPTHATPPDSLDEKPKPEATWQTKPAMPTMPPAAHNPFVSDEFERPMKMVTVTTLEDKTIGSDNKAHRRRTEMLPSLNRKSSNRSLHAKSSIIENGLASLVRKASFTSHDRDRTRRNSSGSSATQSPGPTLNRKSTATSMPPTPPPKTATRVSEAPPALPPLEFDAIVVDDRRASVSVLARPASQAPDAEQIAAFLSRDAEASRDSFVMMLSPTTAARTLSQFVREVNSARSAGGAGGGVVVVNPVRRRSGLRQSGVVPKSPLRSALNGAEDHDAKAEEVHGAAEISETAASGSVPGATLTEEAGLDSATEISRETDKPMPPLAVSEAQSESTTENVSSPPVSTTKQTPSPNTLKSTTPVVVKATSGKDSGPIVTTTEVSGSGSDTDKDKAKDKDKTRARRERPPPPPPVGRRIPPNPRRARPRPKNVTRDGTVLPPSLQARLARSQRTEARPLSAWI